MINTCIKVLFLGQGFLTTANNLIFVLFLEIIDWVKLKLTSVKLLV